MGRNFLPGNPRPSSVLATLDLDQIHGQIHERYSLAAAFGQERAKRQLRTVLRSWLEAAGRRKRVRLSGGTLTALRVQRRLHGGFSFWRAWSVIRLMGRTAVERGRFSRAVRLKRHSMTSWREAAVLGRRRRAAMASMALKRDMLMLRSTFGAWAWCVSRLRIASLVARQRQAVVLRSTFDEWQRWASPRARLSGMGRQLSRMRSFASLSRSFSGWRKLTRLQEATVEAFTRTALLRRCLRRLQVQHSRSNQAVHGMRMRKERSTLHRCLRTLGQEVERAAFVDVLAAEANQRRQLELVSQVLVAWATVPRRFRDIVMAMRAAAGHRVLQGATATWRRWAAVRVAAKAMSHRLDVSLAMRVLGAWASEAASSAKQRETWPILCRCAG